MNAPTLDAILDQLAEAVASRLAERLAEAEHTGKPEQKAGREPDFYTEKEVSTRTGISRRTLQGWRAFGRGPKHTKAGGKVLYPVAELKEFLRARSVLERASRSRTHS